MIYQCPKCGIKTRASKKEVAQFGLPLCNERDCRKIVKAIGEDGVERKTYKLTEMLPVTEKSNG